MARVTDPSRRGRSFRCERGAILIHVGIAILVLTGFSALVLDQGVMLLARNEAQNAADAGALAGAAARAFDETDDPVANGRAATSARAAAMANPVGDSDGTASVSISWTCPAFAPAGLRCARVDVLRNGEAGNDGVMSTALPTFFANIFGVTSQQARASAVAAVMSYNMTTCLRPIAVADNWEETIADGVFKRWNGGGVPIASPDVYVPPSISGPGSGYRAFGASSNVGNLLSFTPISDAAAIPLYGYLPLRVPIVPNPGGDPADYTTIATYAGAIKQCVGNPVVIGQYLPVELDATPTDTQQALWSDLDSVLNSDPAATWVGNEDGAVGSSCAPSCAAFSPRIVPIAAFDVDEYQWRKTHGDWTTGWIPGVGEGGGPLTCPGAECIRVTNIVGLFVLPEPQGRAVVYPTLPSGSAQTPNASFLASVQLIR